MLYYWYSGEFKLNGAHWYFSYIYCVVESMGSYLMHTLTLQSLPVPIFNMYDYSAHKTTWLLIAQFSKFTELSLASRLKQAEVF
jgi:hypothetical protein